MKTLNEPKKLTPEEWDQVGVSEKLVEEQCSDCAYWCRMAWRMLPENDTCLNFRDVIPGLRDVEHENAKLQTSMILLDDYWREIQELKKVNDSLLEKVAAYEK